VLIMNSPTSTPTDPINLNDAQKNAARRLEGITPAQARQMLADQKARLSNGAKKAWVTRRRIWAAEHLEQAAAHLEAAGDTAKARAYLADAAQIWREHTAR
jgi:hypothetical protein